MDDPLIGRVIAFSFLPFFCDLIIIEGKQLTYKGSFLAIEPDKSFDLKNMKNFLILKKKLPAWISDHELFEPRASGTEVMLSIIDINDQKHILIKKFSINLSNMELKTWNRFIHKLCKYSDLPLEEITESV